MYMYVCVYIAEGNKHFVFTERVHILIEPEFFFLFVIFDSSVNIIQVSILQICSPAQMKSLSSLLTDIKN